jgi:hypothetical protein
VAVLALLNNKIKGIEATRTSRRALLAAFAAT